MLFHCTETSLGEKISEATRKLQSKIRKLESIMERLELIPISSKVVEENIEVPQSSAVKPKRYSLFMEEMKYQKPT